MGISFSCPFADYSDLDGDTESVIVKSISFGNDEGKTPLRSVSFKGRDLEDTIMKSAGSGKMTIEASVSFKGRDLEMISAKSASSEEETLLHASSSPKREETNNQPSRRDSPLGMDPALPDFNPTNPRNLAALKLQKVYKSFRTRRKLADCAVLVEQSWWKLLDFAELKRSSISFFDIEKHESAISRWSRARTRVAKVGKGLSKNEKAQKLALQHWLEAIDPRHRYGHNLHFYYVKWLDCQSKEPFFYWLDIGEGKEVNLVEKCPRSKLQQQCIKYLGPIERLAYEVVLENGKFFYKQSGELLHATEEGGNAKWIFVLGTSKNLYVGKKKKGTFQHSSFLAGGATSAAGRLIVENGILKAIWPHSGHYRPTEENFRDFVSFLKENNVDLTDVKMCPDDEDNLLNERRGSRHLRISSYEDDLIHDINGLEGEDVIDEECSAGVPCAKKQEAPSATEKFKMKRPHNLSRKLTNLEIPNSSEFIERLEEESQDVGLIRNVNSHGAAEDAFAPPQNLFDCGGQEDDEEEVIPEELILERLNSLKRTKSYQLGKQLSCKWTTGAGPRIGCVRDYPSKLQVRALEQVSLSPRSAGRAGACLSPCVAGGLSPRISIPDNSPGKTAEIALLFGKVSSAPYSIHLSGTQSSPLSRATSAKETADLS